MRLWVPSKFIGFKNVDILSRSSTPASDNGLLNTKLPNEILDLIFSYLHDRKDLYSLTLTCRRFGLVANSRLYSHIDIIYPTSSIYSASQKPPPNITRYLDIYWSLSASCSSFVTSLTIIPPTCNISHPSPVVQWWRRLSDKCDEVDAQLSDLLQALPNLQNLEIICNACWTPTPEKRHQYLSKLKTRTLRRLSFKCTCTQEPINQTYATLSADCLQTVEDLQWERYSPRDTTGIVFQARELLPKLRKLSYRVNAVLEHFLYCRTITHLSCREWNNALHAAFIQGPSNGKLTWLDMTTGDTTTEDMPWRSDVGRWDFLSTKIKGDPGAFRNITHLGRFSTLYITEEEVLSMIQPFSALIHLSSIEVIDYLSWPPGSHTFSPWKSDLLYKLSSCYPKLSMVYIDGEQTGCSIWTYRGEWSSTRVKRYDTVNGTWEPWDQIMGPPSAFELSC